MTGPPCQVAPLSLLVNSPPLVAATHAAPDKSSAYTRLSNLAHRLLHLFFHGHVMTTHHLVDRLFRGVGNRVSGLPTAVAKGEDSAVGARQQVAIRRLRQDKHVAPVQPFGQVFPLCPAVGGDKHAAVLLVVHHAGIDPHGILPVDDQRLHLARGKPVIVRAQKSRRRCRSSSTPPRSVASSTRCGLAGST